MDGDLPISVISVRITTAILAELPRHLGAQVLQGLTPDQRDHFEAELAIAVNRRVAPLLYAADSYREEAEGLARRIGEMTSRSQGFDPEAAARRHDMIGYVVPESIDKP